MINRATIIFSVLTLLFFASCDKNETRIPDFLVEFATIIKTESSVRIRLDNGNVLSPEDPFNFDVNNGDRVIINYTPLQNSVVKVNRIEQIFLGEIKIKENPDEVKSEPIKIISVWSRGSYLNLSFQVDYHSKAHSVALLKDTQSNSNKLYLIYSREDDPAGAPTLRHLSFNVESLLNEGFTVYINTKNGERKFDF